VGRGLHGLPEPEAIATRSGLIFLGGRATRLDGANKALLDVGGNTILGRILQALETLVSERILLVNDAPGPWTQVHQIKVVYDPRPHAGVLPALAAGLDAATGDVCLAVACDMPFVSGPLFAHLLEVQRRENADVVIPRSSGFVEPMHAVYRRQPVLKAIQSALERGEQRMISYFADVRVVEVGEDEWREVDPSGLAFFNVNTPEDLEEARRIAAGQHP
jgi:molybdopterin-guanine dinucleotide biosynthesis protein A